MLEAFIDKQEEERPRQSSGRLFSHTQDGRVIFAGLVGAMGLLAVFVYCTILSIVFDSDTDMEWGYYSGEMQLLMKIMVTCFIIVQFWNMRTRADGTVKLTRVWSRNLFIASPETIVFVFLWLGATGGTFTMNLLCDFGSSIQYCALNTTALNGFDLTANSTISLEEVRISFTINDGLRVIEFGIQGAFILFNFLICRNVILSRRRAAGLVACIAFIAPYNLVGFVHDVLIGLSSYANLQALPGTVRNDFQLMAYPLFRLRCAAYDLMLLRNALLALRERPEADDRDAGLARRVSVDPGAFAGDDNMLDPPSHLSSPSAAAAVAAASSAQASKQRSWTEWEREQIVDLQLGLTESPAPEQDPLAPPSLEQLTAYTTSQLLHGSSKGCGGCLRVPYVLGALCGATYFVLSVIFAVKDAASNNSSSAVTSIESWQETIPFESVFTAVQVLGVMTSLGLLISLRPRGLFHFPSIEMTITGAFSTFMTALYNLFYMNFYGTTVAGFLYYSTLALQTLVTFGLFEFLSGQVGVALPPLPRTTARSVSLYANARARSRPLWLTLRFWCYVGLLFAGPLLLGINAGKLFGNTVDVHPTALSPLPAFWIRMCTVCAFDVRFMCTIYSLKMCVRLASHPPVLHRVKRRNEIRLAATASAGSGDPAFPRSDSPIPTEAYDDDDDEDDTISVHLHDTFPQS